MMMMIKTTMTMMMLEQRESIKRSKHSLGSFQRSYTFCDCVYRHVKAFQSYSPPEQDRQTYRRDRTYYYTAFATDSKFSASRSDTIDDNINY